MTRIRSDDLIGIDDFREVLKRNDELPWWQEVRAQLRQDVPYTNNLQGDTLALQPYRPPITDQARSFLNLFGKSAEAAQEERLRDDYIVIAKAVRLHQLAQVLDQVLWWWSYDTTWNDVHYQDIPDIRHNFEDGRYMLRISGTGVRIWLPTPEEVAAVPLSARDVGEGE